MNENEQPVESAPAPEQEPVPVVLAELPRITFEWAVIIGAVGFALFVVFGMIAGAAGIR